MSRERMLSDTPRHYSAPQWEDSTADAYVFRLRFAGNPSVEVLREEVDEIFVPGTRQWLFTDLEAWRRRSEAGYSFRVELGFATCPFYVLTAPSGFGKSLALSQYIVQRPHKVLAWHFCRRDDERSRNARRAIRSMAFQFAQKLLPFRESLAQIFLAAGYERREDLVSGDALSTRELFDTLVLGPLKSCTAPSVANGEGKYVIVLDGFETGSDKDGNALGGAVLRHLRRLPHWIGMILSTRPDTPVIQALQDQKLSITQLDFMTFEDEQDQDVQMYVEHAFARRLDIKHPAHHQLRQLLRENVSVSGDADFGMDNSRYRNFLYLHLLISAILEKITEVGWSDARSREWLKGVFRKMARFSVLQLYDVLFKVLYQRYFSEKKQSIKRLFYAIVAAPVPLHAMLELAPLCELNPATCLSHVHVMENIFLKLADDLVGVRHESVREWVYWESGYLYSNLHINQEMCHYYMAKACAKVLMQYNYVHFTEGEWLPSDAAALRTLTRAFNMKESDAQIATILGETLDTTRLQAYALMYTVYHLLHAHPPTHSSVRISVHFDTPTGPAYEPMANGDGEDPNSPTSSSGRHPTDESSGVVAARYGGGDDATTALDDDGKGQPQVQYEVEVYLHMALRICCSISFNIESVRILGYTLGREQRYLDLCRLCSFPETQGFEFTGLRLLKAAYKSMRRHWRYQDFLDDDFIFLEQIWQRFSIPFEECMRNAFDLPSADEEGEENGRVSLLDDIYDKTKHIFRFYKPRSFESICRTFLRDLDVKRKIETGLCMVGRIPGLLADSKVIDREILGCEGPVECVATLCLPLVYGSAPVTEVGVTTTRVMKLEENVKMIPLYDISGERRVSTYLIFVGIQHDIFIYEYDSYDHSEPLQVLMGHGGLITGLSAAKGESGNGYLCSASEDRTIRIWASDATSHRTLAPMFNVIFTCANILKGHRLEVTAVHVHCASTGRSNAEDEAPALAEHLRIYSGSEDQRIFVWHEGGTRSILRGHSGAVTSVHGITLRDGNRVRELLVSGSEDKTIRLWDTDHGEVLRIFKRLTKFVTFVTALVVNPATIFIAAASMDKDIKLFRYDANAADDDPFNPDERAQAEMEPVMELQGHTREVTGLAIVRSIYDQTVSSDASAPFPYEDDAATPLNVAAKASESFILLSSSRDNTVRIWLVSFPKYSALENGKLSRFIHPDTIPESHEYIDERSLSGVPQPSYATEIVDLHGNWGMSVACTSDGPREGTLVISGAKDGYICAHMLDMAYALASNAALQRVEPGADEEALMEGYQDPRVSLADNIYVAPSARDSLVDRPPILAQDSLTRLLTTGLSASAGWADAVETAMRPTVSTTLGDLYVTQRDVYRSLRLTSLAGSGSYLFAGSTDRMVRAWELQVQVEVRRPEAPEDPEELMRKSYSAVKVTSPGLATKVKSFHSNSMHSSPEIEEIMEPPELTGVNPMSKASSMSGENPLARTRSKPITIDEADEDAVNPAGGAVEDEPALAPPSGPPPDNLMSQALGTRARQTSWTSSNGGTKLGIGAGFARGSIEGSDFYFGDERSSMSSLTTESEADLHQWVPEVSFTLEGHLNVVTCITSWTSPEGVTYLASGSEDQDVRVFDVQSDAKEAIHVLRGHKGPITCLCAWAAPKATLVSGSEDLSLRVWDVETGSLLHILRGHRQTISCVFPWCDPEGNLIVLSSSRDATVRCWDIHQDKNPVKVYRENDSGPIFCVTAWYTSAPNEFVATGAEDGRIRVYDARGDASAMVQMMEGHTAAVTALTPCYTGAQCFLASGSMDNTVRLWSLSAGAAFEDDSDCICLYQFDAEVASLFWLGSSSEDSERGSSALHNILVAAVNNLSGPAFLEVWDADDATGNLESYDEIYEQRQKRTSLPFFTTFDRSVEGTAQARKRTSAVSRGSGSKNSYLSWISTREGLAVALGISTGLVLATTRRPTRDKSDTTTTD